MRCLSWRLRLLLVLSCAALAAGCGGGSDHVDAGLDAARDAGLDAARDAVVDSAVGVDAAVDADAGALGCRSNADCASDSVDVRCAYDGRCVPASCVPTDRDPCPEPLSCVRHQCLPRACPACAEGMACDPVSSSCLPEVSPAACRGMGGMYVRGRCMRPERPDVECDGGYASEPLATRCDVPVIPGANLGSVGIVRIGPFPVARVGSPVPGSLSVHRPWRGGESIIWQFDYVDPSVDGSGATTELELFPDRLGSERSGGCIRPGAPGFAARPLCAELPPNSDCNCGQIPILSVARDEQRRLAVAGRDDTGHAHFELWDRALPEELRPRLVSYYTPQLSEVWSPLVIGADADGELFARVGLAGPLDLLRLFPAAPYAQLATGAGLSTGGEFVAWSDQSVIAKRATDGALLRFLPSSVVPEVLAEAGAPAGRYQWAPGRAAGPYLVAQTLSASPSALTLHGEPTASGASMPTLNVLAVESNLGPAAAIATAGDLAWLFAAVPHATGGFTVDRVVLSRRGEAPQHVPLITSEDVGGEIVSVTDLALHWKLDGCGGASIPNVLVAAMLEIRQADASVVHELWAVSVTWQ
ncbi:MAG: hypothetical protein GXP55_12605 [Deltaproteobacteria bacterium]|nr:hypothetical protein [Deltaproteobacteria bacterium]